MSSTVLSFAPVSARSGKPVQLAMQRLFLTGQVLPAGARLVVQHVFRSEEEKPLEVIYSFPLPRDAALRRFRITGEAFEAHSELKQTEAAVKAFEEGIAAGALSVLARQYGDGLVNLTVGNIHCKEAVTVWLEILAGVELKDDGFRFRFPFTLAPSYHAGAKTAMIAHSEGEMELPSAEFGDVILPRFREDASALHQIGFDLSIATQLDLEEIGSPSHPVRIKQNGARAAQIGLAAGKDVPDRDLVLDGRFKVIQPQVLAGRDKSGKTRLAAIVPSTVFGANPEVPRRVVILLDRSGSMSGEPISQARKAIQACLSVLSDSDSFGLIAFDSVPEVFHPALQQATREVREQARAFLDHVDARGGTELAAGVDAAAKLLQGGSGDILIMTDGQVLGTEKILESARAAGVRLHCLGIGSASQDRFLTLLARETGGVSRFVTPRERVDLSTVDLFASIGRPVATGLKAGANIQPEPASMVFGSTPVLLFGEGEANVDVTWNGGQLILPVSCCDDTLGETLWLLQGSRLITDWESRYPSIEALAPLEKRKQSRVAMRLQQLSETYGLASREASLVAVVKRAGDRPGELPETHVVAVGMPQDTAFASYFQSRPRIMASALGFTGLRQFLASAPQNIRHVGEVSTPMQKATFLQRMAAGDVGAPDLVRNFEPEGQGGTPGGPIEALVELASRMDSDGGMPGRDVESRAAATAVALLAFVSHGHTPSSGAFRSHVRRLVSFLKKLTGVSKAHEQLIAGLIRRVEKGEAPAGDWIGAARGPGDHWDQLAKAL